MNLLELAAARQRVLDSFRLHYRVTSLEELTTSRVPGYWRRKHPCGGLKGGCRAPIHGCMFNEGPMHHTLSYFDPYRDNRGRFASRTRTWKICREAELLEDGELKRSQP